MDLVRILVELGHAKRKEAEIKLRQPLASLTYSYSEKLHEDLEKIISEELNVKDVKFKKSTKSTLQVTLDTKITIKLKDEGEARELIRNIQKLRKEMDLTLKDKITVAAEAWPKDFEDFILKSTASITITKGPTLKITKI